MICGAPLEYHLKEKRFICYYCGKKFLGYIICSKGHAICEDCHNRPAIEKTKEICLATTSDNPFHIFESILESPNISMLGCHHAFMVAGSLLAAIKNAGKTTIAEDTFDEVFSRISKQAFSGYCGLTGVCGIVPAIGGCFSILLGAKCGTDREQKTTMNVTAKIAQAVAELTGPSCCKAYSWKSLEIALKFLKEELNISLTRPEQRIVCNYDTFHPHGCRKEKCPYYKKLI
ncbi:Methyltransferase [Dissulfuribacter thermophilus]|uniref:Methyltransferase n=1 Tax=Dissulfuribacter thermophilus TaxID=1156395 RepID=A0A1B9F8D3_9BACT|nr:DUF5714 domain-containing protein [Dissulfuribacter thermophilus]OCC16133.1 Methyltransferase [Dissulfuribacter thermophilus]